MTRTRLVLGLAAVFAGLTVLLLVLASVFRDPVVLFVALPFGAATYFFWYHATGRLEARVRRQARRDAARGERARRERGGFGAGPRETWTPPRDRTARGRRRTGRRRARRPPGPTDRGITDAEARRELGVGADASDGDIKRAYRERVKEVHPDTEGGDEEAFKRVTRAYEHLTE